MPPPTTTTTRPAPALPDELLEEIFLRLPPDEPEHLVRASLACKLWLGLLSGARFRGLYREFHGAPPMLGFLYNWFFCSGPKEDDPVANFVSTTKFGALVPDGDGWDRQYTPWDCRHGRVLLGDYTGLIVWDPMTGRQMKLEAPVGYVGAAVLCAVRGCDHRACHEGPFRVVLIGLDMNEDDGDCVAHACVSSPVTPEWSKECSDSHFDGRSRACSDSRFDGWSKQCSGLYLLAGDPKIDALPPVLVDDALHFRLTDDDERVGILKYDLSSNCLSMIDVPLTRLAIVWPAILMALEDGSLGLAHLDGLTLYLWSRLIDSNGVASWTQHKVIDLNELLPIQNPKKRISVIGSVEGHDIIFVNIDLGIYEINLKTLRWKKLWKREKFRSLIPYMSFYNRQERVRPCKTLTTYG
ncbi:unnamed protein product [Triticum turgidum subsp. durum]|uniref:F-box domain-containing protein n=1 Tax=Triticum turgidum subsp. durum TaxID=4567 RepID=A0A9R0SK39_TRITD|nr:unnamed protein product [Triticum turgidum subsp. durum]